MIEIYAALVASSLTLGGLGFAGFIRFSSSVTRLTVAVERVEAELREMHQDSKGVAATLAEHGSRIAVVETQCVRHEA